MATQPGVVTAGVLPYQEILDLCGLSKNDQAETDGQGPIRPCRRENVRSASYDLRLGAAFHSTDASPKAKDGVRGLDVSRLTEGLDEHIVLPPNQVVVVSSLEKVHMLDDMVGHLTLKQDLLLQGVIMASQSQIDAGYEGWIYSLLYNLTDRDVTLHLHESVIRLELVRLPQRSDKPYDGHYQNAPLARSLKRPIGSSLEDLRQQIEERGEEVDQTRAAMKEEIDEERKRNKRTRLGAAIVLAVTVLVPFLSGFVGDVYGTRDRVSGLEGQLAPSSEALKTQDRQIRGLETQVSALRCRIEESEGLAKSGRC
jgi:deoxycytidine triphosphate deaminase